MYSDNINFASVQLPSVQTSWNISPSKRDKFVCWQGAV